MGRARGTRHAVAVEGFGDVLGARRGPAHPVDKPEYERLRHDALAISGAPEQWSCDTPEQCSACPRWVTPICQSASWVGYRDTLRAELSVDRRTCEWVAAVRAGFGGHDDDESAAWGRVIAHGYGLETVLDALNEYLNQTAQHWPDQPLEPNTDDSREPAFITPEIVADAVRQRAATAEFTANV